MEVNNAIGENQDGVAVAQVASISAPPGGERTIPRTGTGNRKRRRGKHKRKVTKPFVRPRVWSAERRRASEERFRRVRAQPPSEAPYNNNQFLMEIHAPEAEPSRTRDSSFSVDSEENYLYSLPEDEEEFLTKEFSSVYEDAACERLAGLSKAELLQEYLALEARYESVSRGGEAELRRRLREREQQVRELQQENDKLRQQLAATGAATASPAASVSSVTSADSESDSSSTLSSAPTSRSASPDLTPIVNGHCDVLVNGHSMMNGTVSPGPDSPLCNGFHDDEDV